MILFENHAPSKIISKDYSPQIMLCEIKQVKNQFTVIFMPGSRSDTIMSGSKLSTAFKLH